MDSPPSELSPDNGSSRGRSKKHHKKRVRVWTEDDRARHRVFEKGRREAFSDSLLTLARFLPNLTSVKESKLSKHTIVDESLKYHEVQKAKLEDLQKTVDALKAEKEALLVELSGWRECLDATPLQAAPAEVLEANALQSDAIQVGSHDSMPMYDAIVIPGPITTHEAPPLVPVSYGAPAVSTVNPMPDAQLLDNYTFQTSTVMPADELNFNNLPRTSQYSLTQVGARDQSLQHALWSFLSTSSVVNFQVKGMI
ncbi:hypothetical protein MBLNU13_g01610t1 [Cladosporium sp. NU13]